MKILLVTHYYNGHGGGIEVVAHQLACRLAADFGHKIVWAASDETAKPGCKAPYDTAPMGAFNWTEEKLGIPYPLWGPRALARIARLIRDSDLLHLHDTLYMGNVAAMCFAKRSRKPVVLTQHIAEVPYTRPALNTIMRLAYATIGRFTLEGADQVVFYSRRVLGHFAKRIRFRAEPLYIPNGVDTGLFHPVGEEDQRRLRYELGWPIDQPVRLFVGRFVEKKGLQVVRILAQRRPHELWVLAGKGPINPGSWGLPNVRVYQGRSETTLAPLYQAADLLVLPSVGEGFPLVVQEAMACGTPVLTNAETLGGDERLASVIDASPIDPMDPDRACEAFMPQLESKSEKKDKKSRRNMVAAFAREEWSWDKAAQAYHRIFLTLVGGGGEERTG
jgi:glycosyltransferase involved in cell wall biosynthesis